MEKGEDYLFMTDRHGRSSHRSIGQPTQALELLLKVPVSDVVSSANWPQLQQELCESLRDDSWMVFVQVLKVLARLSSSISFNPVREGFLSMLEGLTLYYLTQHLHQQLPSATHGIQFENNVHKRIILISQCLLQALNQAPGKWIRYGEKRAQEIIDNFVDLLSMHTHHHRNLSTDVNQSKDILYPFHIFCVLDPEAKWCEGVMHAAFGRSILLKCLIKAASLIRFIVEEVIIWLNGQMKPSDNVTVVYEYGGCGNISGSTINLAVFTHCISLIAMLVRCDKGSTAFPIMTSIQEDPVSVYYLLLKLVEFLNKISNESRIIHSDRLVRVLECACATIILSKWTNILSSSSAELVHLIVNGPTGADYYSLHAHNINILCKISESPLAIRWMLGRPVRKTREGISRFFSERRMMSSSATSSGRESTLTGRGESIARKVAKATTYAVKDKSLLTFDTITPLCQLLTLSGKLFSTPEGYLILECCEGQLIHHAGQLLIFLMSTSCECDLGFLIVQQSCVLFLISVAQTPLGFVAVSAVENLLKCLFTFYIENPLTTQYYEPKFLNLLRLSTCIPDVKLHTIRRSLMKQALRQLWYSREQNSEWIWQEAKQLFLTFVLSICSTPQVLSEMLEDHEHDDCSSESTLTEEVEPLSLRELLERGLLAFEFNPSCSQDIAFNVLHSFAHNIDLVFVLHEKIKLIEHLQRLISDSTRRECCNGLTVQPSPRKEKVTIADETARSCSRILSIVNQLKDATSCSSLLWLRSPRSPRTHAHTSRPRIQTDLHRFLQDTRHGLHDSMWISHAKRAFRTSSRFELKVSVLVDLLDQLVQSQPSHSLHEISFKWPTTLHFPTHSPKYLQAIKTIVRYGCQVKALNANMINQHVEQLSLVLHQSQVFLGLQKKGCSFDWFTSSVFIMCGGNVDRTCSVLLRVATLPTASFIWPLLSQSTLQMKAAMNQQLQGLIIEYVPKAYSALLEAGVPWWLVSEQLAHQAFLPAISISQFPHLIALIALHPWEYNLYLHTSILAHLQPELLDLSVHRSIQALLMELRLDNFLIGDYLPFMDQLAKLNRPHLVRDRISTATL